jgi:hypothetical protein
MIRAEIVLRNRGMMKNGGWGESDVHCECMEMLQ